MKFNETKHIDQANEMLECYQAIEDLVLSSTGAGRPEGDLHQLSAGKFAMLLGHLNAQLELALAGLADKPQTLHVAGGRS